MSRVSESIMRGLQEVLESVEGKRELCSRLYTIVPVREHDAQEINELWNNFGMPQSFFAIFIGVSKKTFEAWGFGRNMPVVPARRILSMVQSDPALQERHCIIEV